MATRRYAIRVNPFIKPSDRKKVLMALYKKFKTIGDGAIRGGKHVVMLATEGYRTIALEDQPDDEIIRLARKYGILKPLARENPRPSRTYAFAQREIMDELESRGWSLSSRSLKTPHATIDPSRSFYRVWFRPQAIYFSYSSDFGSARSLSLPDIRKMSAKQVVDMIEANRARHNPVTTREGRRLRAKGGVRASARLMAERNAAIAAGEHPPARRGRLSYQSASYILGHHAAKKRRAKTRVHGQERARESRSRDDNMTVFDWINETF